MFGWTINGEEMTKSLNGKSREILPETIKIPAAFLRDHHFPEWVDDAIDWKQEE